MNAALLHGRSKRLWRGGKVQIDSDLAIQSHGHVHQGSPNAGREKDADGLLVLAAQLLANLFPQQEAAHQCFAKGQAFPGGIRHEGLTPMPASDLDGQCAKRTLPFSIHLVMGARQFLDGHAHLMNRSA